MVRPPLRKLIANAKYWVIPVVIAPPLPRPVFGWCADCGDEGGRWRLQWGHPDAVVCEVCGGEWRP